MIEKLEKLLAEATPGPWKYRWNGMYSPPTVVLRDYPHITVTSSDEDAKLIAALRNLAPELFAVVWTAGMYRKLYCDDNERLAGKNLDTALDALEKKLGELP